MVVDKDFEAMAKDLGIAGTNITRSERVYFGLARFTSLETFRRFYEVHGDSGVAALDEAMERVKSRLDRMHDMNCQRMALVEEIECEANEVAKEIIILGMPISDQVDTGEDSPDIKIEGTKVTFDYHD